MAELRKILNTIFHAKKSYAVWVIFAFCVVQGLIVYHAVMVWQIMHFRGYATKTTCPTMNMSEHTWQDFYKQYATQQTPVVLKDVVSKWPAMQKWTNKYLRSKLGKVEMTVNRAVPGVLFGPITGVELPSTRMLFSEFLDRLEDKNETTLHYLNLQGRLPNETKSYTGWQTRNVAEEYMPEDFYYPEEMPFPRETSSVNFWMGPGGMVSRLHRDSSDNFLCQIDGYKRFVVFPPTCTDYLYPREHNATNFSYLDLDNVDYEKYPLVRQAEPYKGECVAGPGDMLYVPPNWWHQVYSTQRNVALNIWYEHPSLAQQALIGLRIMYGI